MAISKKRKRILWIAIPMAVLAIAALLIWLLLGQPEPEKPFEILRSQTTGNIVDCQLREGAVEATGDGSTPQPYYTLTPPQGWTQTEEVKIRYPAGGEASPDVFQSQEGVEMSFSQGRSAVLDLNSLDPATIQEVQFGDNQVIYSQTTTTAWDGAQQVSRTTTQVYWVEAQNLFSLRCYQDFDVNQMLEWVSLVSYENPRMLAYEPPPIQPLELVRGGITQETGEDGFTLYEMEYYRSEGNPEIPESVPSYTFPQAPEGWTLLGGDTIQVGKTLEKYQNQDGEVLALLCVTGPATLFEVETGTTHFYLPFTGGMGWAELEDQSSVQDATVNGNPAFVHINEEVSEIAWIDGCCTLQLRSTAPLTQEELVALAESVQGDVYYNVQGE